MYLLVSSFPGHWMFGLLLCDFFVTSDVLMCTSSILHLCTISLERYIGIRYPLWTKNKSKRIVLLKIVMVWTIALAITSPITVLGVVKSENILQEGRCNLTNEPFLIYGSIFAFFIPLAIMVLMYGLTVNMLNNQARLGLRRGAEDGEGQPMIRRSTSRRNWQTRRKFYGRELLSVSAAYTSSRSEDYECGNGLTCPVIHQRFGTVNGSRNNTVPLCHHHAHHSHRHYENRLDPASAASGNANLLGSNNSINNLHRGRSGNNNSNSGGGCVPESNNVVLNNALNIRRGRYAAQNGRSGSAYAPRGSPPDYPYCNGHEEDLPSEMISDSRNCCSSILSSSSSSSSPSSSSREPKRLRELVRKHHVAVKAANILLMKREDQPVIPMPSLTPPSSSTYASVRRDNSVRTEQKASKVLGVVFMIFVICWAPFFTVNILTPLCTSCNFESTLVTAFVWLGYVSSTLNPIIYTIFNNIFRITFIKLLCCRYRLLHRARRTSNLPGLRNGMMGCNTFGATPVSINVPSATPTATMIEESNC
uniref:G-protein coupled receptors family 1 profile domain-containing protein n=1 Tax=Biomphalaria glabrata TaxID=6526 RepID=A0A2C9K3Q9_BIOGL